MRGLLQGSKKIPCHFPHPITINPPPPSPLWRHHSWWILGLLFFGGTHNFGPSGVVWHLAETVERSDPHPHSPFSPPSKSSFSVSSWAIVKKLVVQISPEREEFNSTLPELCDALRRRYHRTNWSRNELFYSSLPPLTTLQSHCSLWVLGRMSKKLVQISPEQEELKFCTSRVVWRLAETVERATRKRKNFLIYFFLAVCLRSSSSIVQDTNRSSHYQQKI